MSSVSLLPLLSFSISPSSTVFSSNTVPICIVDGSIGLGFRAHLPPRLLYHVGRCLGGNPRPLHPLRLRSPLRPPTPLHPTPRVRNLPLFGATGGIRRTNKIRRTRGSASSVPSPTPTLRAPPDRRPARNLCHLGRRLLPCCTRTRCPCHLPIVGHTPWPWKMHVVVVVRLAAVLC